MRWIFDRSMGSVARGGGSPQGRIACETEGKSFGRVGLVSWWEGVDVLKEMLRERRSWASGRSVRRMGPRLGKSLERKMPARPVPEPSSMTPGGDGDAVSFAVAGGDGR